MTSLIYTFSTYLVNDPQSYSSHPLEFSWWCLLFGLTLIPAQTILNAPPIWTPFTWNLKNVVITDNDENLMMEADCLISIFPKIIDDQEPTVTLSDHSSSAHDPHFFSASINHSLDFDEHHAKSNPSIHLFLPRMSLVLLILLGRRLQS